MVRANPHQHQVQHTGCSLGTVSLLRTRTLSCIAGLVLLGGQALGQARTQNPAAWRSLTYSNLQQPGKPEETFFDIWVDAIANNNRAYVARGDRRFLSGNAPVTEGHFVIWTPKRSVVISILNTALGCTLKSRETVVRAIVRLCPMRVAIYEGLRVETMEAGRACLVEPELGSTIDPTSASTSASYDVASRTVKLGTIVNHRAVDGCSFTLPIGRD